MTADTTAAVLFVDTSGSVRLFAARGDAAATALVTDAMGRMEDAVTSHGGRVVKRTGDGIHAVFATAAPALAAAVAIQAGFDGAAGAEVRVRSAIHQGPVTSAAGDVYGTVVNVAARLVARARANEILLSADARAELPVDQQRALQPVGEIEVRGHPVCLGLYRFEPELDGATIRVAGASIGTAVRLELRRGEQCWVIHEPGATLSIGRDPASDVVVSHTAASRHHAEITLRGGNVVLSDWSVNGTVLEGSSAERLRLLRDETKLVGRGRIFPGSLLVEPLEYAVGEGGG